MAARKQKKGKTMIEENPMFEAIIIHLPMTFEVEDSNLYAGAIQHEEKEETEILDAASYWVLIAMMIGLMIYFN